MDTTNSGGGTFGDRAEPQLCDVDNLPLYDTRAEAYAVAAEHPGYRPWYSVGCKGWHLSNGRGGQAQRRRRERREDERRAAATEERRTPPISG